jgi:hypothetical protein
MRIVATLIPAHDTLSAAMLEARRTWARAALAALAVAFLWTRAAADDKPLSFAFASQAGSGIYSIEGRVVQIYRIPVSFGAKRLGDEEGDWGIQVSSPLTFGFYDFRPEELLNGEVPTHVGTASLLPGVAFPVRAKTNWILTPYIDLGAAKNFEGGDLVWVYDAGLRSDVTFPAGSWDGLTTQELLWAGAAQTGNALTGWYGEAMAGSEFRHLLPWSSGRSQWDLGLFAVYRRYFKDNRSNAVAYAAAAPDPTPTTFVDEQTEIGISFGTRPKLSWWKISMPNLGLSYRFGDGVQGIRLIFGASF